MKKVLLVVANLTALSCAMRDWVFNVPERIFIFNILSIVFIASWLLFFSVKSRERPLASDLKIFLSLLWIYYAVEILSGVGIIINPVAPESFTQYYRIILSHGVFTVFATCFCLFLCELEPRQRHRILKYYVAGVVLSSLYGLAGSVLYKRYGIRIETFIWDYVSYNAAGRFDNNLTWAVMGVRRGIGFPGVNPAAAYNLTVIPLLLIFVLRRGRLVDYLLYAVCIVGLLVTVSRSGFLSFAASLLILVPFLLKSMRFSPYKLAVIVLPFVVVGCFCWNQISEIVHFRQITDLSRELQWESGIQMFTQNPLLGVGANNFSLARETLGSQFYTDENLHNSWLTILVELGIAGLACYVLFFLFILRKTFLRRDALSIGLFSAMAGLCVGAMSHQLLDLFFFKFFLTLAFSLVILGDGENTTALSAATGNSMQLINENEERRAPDENGTGSGCGRFYWQPSR